jgi:hypothetical protein
MVAVAMFVDGLLPVAVGFAVGYAQLKHVVPTAPTASAMGSLAAKFPKAISPGPPRETNFFSEGCGY